MMGALTDRVVVVTGAGRGLGREYAHLAAAEGALVVVNDLGAEPNGTGSDPAIAASVAAEIVSAGGVAFADTSDISTMDGASAVLAAALERFGRVDGLVNNAGILRDRMFVNMSEDDWDAVIRGQLRGTFAPCRVFSEHWRTESRSHRDPHASIVNVSSTSGLNGAVGQTNYGAAKAAIASLTVILAQELSRYGMRVNAVVPVARTRMTENIPAFKEMLAAPADPAEFDIYHPGNVAPLVAWLLTESCTANGDVFYAKGGEIREFRSWTYGWTLDKGSRWTVAELGEQLAQRV